jgi:hypothetical protein
MDNGDPRFPSSRYLRVPFIFVPKGSPPPLEWMREHPQYLRVLGFFTPRPPPEPNMGLEPQPGAEGQAEPPPEKLVLEVVIDYAGKWTIRPVEPLTPRPAPRSEPSRPQDPEPEVEPEPPPPPARERPAWQRVVPPPGPLIYPPARERPAWQRCVPPPGPRRAASGPPPLGPNPAACAFDPLLPEFHARPRSSDDANAGWYGPGHETRRYRGP